MKFRHHLLLLLSLFLLAACQTAKAPTTDTPSSGVAQAEVSGEAPIECFIEEVPEGWWCYYFDPVAFMLLTDDFESYGSERSGNFIAAETNTFIHAGGFPFIAFPLEAQEFLREGKIKEYMLYEQEQACLGREECPSQLLEDSFEDVTLGGREFFKYIVEVPRDGQIVKSLHYATLLEDSLMDFSSSENEPIPVPFESDTIVRSLMIDEALFESMLETLLEI